MKHFLTASILIATLAALTGCFKTFAESRAEYCPNCTDAEWQIKVEEDEARSAKYREEENALRLARIADAAELAISNPNCYAKFKQEIEYLGVNDQLRGRCYYIQEDQTNQDLAEGEIDNQNPILIDNQNPILVGEMKGPIIRTNAPVKRWDNKGNPRSWLTAQSPLWACLDRKRWVWDTIKGQTRHLDRTSVDEGFCTSDANTQGKTFRIEASVTPYIPPPQDNSIGAIFKSINPINVLKGCKPLNTAGGLVKGLATANIGLGICRTIMKISTSDSKKLEGWTEITLDGKLVKVCAKNKEHSFNPTGNAMPCFGKFLGDKKQRKNIFEYTRIRPDNAFGPAGSVSILESCANRNNWAHYGRDATSEQVAFCKTRKTVQNNKAYQIEARQLRVGTSEQIKITIGRKKISKLDLRTNTRIRDVVKVYECGNKSFSRMKNNPRETAVACIQDMLGVIAANRNKQNAPAQNIATQLEALGGYGRTRTEEEKALGG